MNRFCDPRVAQSGKKNHPVFGCGMLERMEKGKEKGKKGGVETLKVIVSLPSKSATGLFSSQNIFVCFLFRTNQVVPTHGISIHPAGGPT